MESNYLVNYIIKSLQYKFSLRSFTWLFTEMLFKFIRYLRGYGSVEEGAKAYRKMLTTRAKYTHVDEMRKLIGEDIENTGINGKQPDFLKYAKDENEKNAKRVIKKVAKEVIIDKPET